MTMSMPGYDRSSDWRERSTWPAIVTTGTVRSVSVGFVADTAWFSDDCGATDVPPVSRGTMIDWPYSVSGIFGNASANGREALGYSAYSWPRYCGGTNPPTSVDANGAVRVSSAASDSRCDVS